MFLTLRLKLTKLGYNCVLRNISSIKINMDTSNLIQLVKSYIPTLNSDYHKGQAGRIGIIGGSLEYTGAPYFAGISALRVGADLVHVFCASTAATVIKSYSPELIVHPLLDHSNASEEISPWFDRLHAIVIGPGLGREVKTLKVVSDILNLIKEKRIPLIIDADGLFLITEKPELLENFQSPIILTPNKIEFERLYNKLNAKTGLSSLGKNVVILKKGSSDELISVNPAIQWKSSSSGSGRRCGGQGDLLSGSLATFLNWTLTNKDNITSLGGDRTLTAASLSCYASSRLIRLCNEKAFKSKGRSMLATDMIEYIHEAFEELFGQ